MKVTLEGGALDRTIRTLWAQKLRSALTMLGIAWGVASLLLLVGLGEGFRSGNRKQLAQLGEDVIFVFAGRIPLVTGNTNGLRQYFTTYRDFTDVRDECGAVKRVGPVLTRSDLKAVSPYQNSDSVVSGVTPDFARIRYTPMRDGRWLNPQDEADARQVAVIGFEMRRNLFPNMGTSPVGEFILLNGQRFLVIGAMEAIGTNENNPNNARIYVPYQTMRKLFPLKSAGLPKDAITNLVYQPVSREEHVKARDQVRCILSRNHAFDRHLTEAFEELDTVQSAEAIGKIFDTMNMFLGCVGVVTLALGGVGVVNIMLVTVGERSREIGVLKAVGATYRTVLKQFFLEGALLTAFSGGAGILVAAVSVKAMRNLPFPAGFDPPRLVPWSVGLCLGLLSIAGIVAGLYPARKAARLQPVEAMRRD